MRVFGWATTHPLETAGIIWVLKTPSLHPWGKATAANIGRSAGSFVWNQTKITYKHLIKPGAKHVGKKIAQRYVAAEAASIVTPTAFGVGVAGAAVSLIAIGVKIAEGKGQSGIQIAPGQKEYEEHAIRIGGGRGVVI